MAEVPPFLWADSGDFDSPKVYEVPGAGEVQPYTATATFTNNSGQAILPALRIKSDTGNLLSLTFPVGQTIADGDSQEVTFVPPFGSAQGSATPTASSGLTNAVVLSQTPQTVGHPGDVLVSWDGAQFGTTDSANYSFTGGSGQQIVVTGTGLYMFFARLELSAPVSAATVNAYIQTKGDPSHGQPWLADSSQGLDEVGANLFHFNGTGTQTDFLEVIGWAYMASGNGTDTSWDAQVRFQNNGTANVTLESRYFLAVQFQPITNADILANIPANP